MSELVQKTVGLGPVKLEHVKEEEVKNLPEVKSLRLDTLKPSRTFKRGDMQVDEFIVPWTNDSKKMMWVRSGYMGRIVDEVGAQVPVFHGCYKGEPGCTAEGLIRRLIAEEWDKHYGT